MTVNSLERPGQPTAYRKDCRTFGRCCRTHRPRRNTGCSRGLTRFGTTMCFRFERESRSACKRSAPWCTTGSSVPRIRQHWCNWSRCALVHQPSRHRLMLAGELAAEVLAKGPGWVEAPVSEGLTAAALVAVALVAESSAAAARMLAGRQRLALAVTLVPRYSAPACRRPARCRQRGWCERHRPTRCRSCSLVGPRAGHRTTRGQRCRYRP